jgi:hypothetical protein
MPSNLANHLGNNLMSLWVTGTARSGKTTTLVNHFASWVRHYDQENPNSLDQVPPALIFAATGDNRLVLMERLVGAIGGSCPVYSTTPLGFFHDEVVLFWPILARKLQLKSLFPLKLRSETEQLLATQFWQDCEAKMAQQPDAMPELLFELRISLFRLVRRALDLLLLAASAEVPIADLGLMLQEGLPPDPEGNDQSDQRWTYTGQWLQRWRAWCLERGLLTYGILTDLYGQHLLPDPDYQRHLHRRFQVIFADDVDEYPALVQSLCTILLEQGARGVFTYNPQGSVRLGFGADPSHLATLADHCQVLELPTAQADRTARFGDSLVQLVQGGNLGWGDGDQELLTTTENPFRLIQATARSQLLRNLATVIGEAVRSNTISPQDIAIIGPSNDAITRYALMEILGKQGIPLHPLTEQRALIQSPRVRALLTLMALVYSGLGRLLGRDQVAEMLMVLSGKLSPVGIGMGGEEVKIIHRIDAVRAGLLADHCYVPDPDHPDLLDITAFPRWDRLGAKTAQAYRQILAWVQGQKQLLIQGKAPHPLTLLDRAIQGFLGNGSYLAPDQLATLRSLMDTAHHFWQVQACLEPRLDPIAPALIRQFIQLLREGTITADPSPIEPTTPPQAVTLATIFQYRLNRCAHRWQFWLDVGSPSWLTKGGGLFGAALFLRGRQVQGWSLSDQFRVEELRLQQTLLDLLGRTERVYLCHSELATNGQEQFGPLLPLVYTTLPIEDFPSIPSS